VDGGEAASLDMEKASEAITTGEGLKRRLLLSPRSINRHAT
jgi:hypothetical protein